jgi:hypothetical protein
LRLPLRAPRRPRASGKLHDPEPLALGTASHSASTSHGISTPGASKCMGLFSGFFVRLAPRWLGIDVSDNGLTAFSNKFQNASFAASRCPLPFQKRLLQPLNGVPPFRSFRRGAISRQPNTKGAATTRPSSPKPKTVHQSGATPTP